MFDKLKKAASEGVDSIKDGATSLAKDARGKVSDLTSTTKYTVINENKGTTSTEQTLEQVIQICAQNNIYISEE